MCAAHGTNMRLLVGEDNRRLSAALARSLEDASYAVDVAYAGVRFSSLVTRFPPSVTVWLGLAG
jgi:DNA-binding response OmpR family regulator